MISQPPITLCENFRSCEVTLWHTSARSPYTHFAAAKWLQNLHLEILHFARDSISYQEEPSQSTPPVFSDRAMARTRGAKSSSPSTRLRIPRDTPVQGSTSEPSRPRVVPPPVEDTPSVLRPGVITQEESSSEPTPSLPPAKKSPPPAKKPQPSQTPARESQIPPGMTPEVAIRRLMVTQPPIKGNYDCRARPFHSELCFDIATFRLQPELRDSFHLLQRGEEFCWRHDSFPIGVSADSCPLNGP
ncbi:hypothetical protein CK203_061016 [Vitis vinifera]|uniref:Uncharacterized protein n=1 Tax=Vitis vinifera TaxID=29760 RepID=A0A438GH33_VITVI|nr:hypothetical protein CK203_061016 [Vitis vinifera]